jgi:hypothetical protein
MPVRGLSIQHDPVQVKHEPWQDILARDSGGSVERLDGSARSIDLDRASERIDQPAQTSSLSKILAHFFLELILAV